MTEEQRRERVERVRDVDEVMVQFHELEVRRGEEQLRLRAIEARSEPEAAPGQVWPADRPLPSHYLKPQPLPCSGCRRVRMPDGAQAVVLMAARETIVYLRCKACGHRYAMPIRPAR